MPMSIIPAPLFADVPQSPGVPAILREIGFVETTVVLLMADAALIVQTLFRTQRWGIFLQTGQPAILGDTVVALEARRDWRVADFPIEQGGFASYNKVIHPLEVRVSFTKGGSLQERAAFLENLKAAARALTLFDVRTPEITYYGMNIVHYDYRRERQSGATLLNVDVWLQEIRPAGPTTFTASNTQTQSPNGAAVENTGPVQALVPREGLA